MAKQIKAKQILMLYGAREEKLLKKLPLNLKIRRQISDVKQQMWTS